MLTVAALHSIKWQMIMNHDFKTILKDAEVAQSA
jgi:hypothetical protein